jgi:hypothetical protein
LKFGKILPPKINIDLEPAFFFGQFFYVAKVAIIQETKRRRKGGSIPHVKASYKKGSFHILGYLKLFKKS